MKDINELTKKIIKFREDRDWKQFHNPKDLAISLSLEASEVLEHFLWQSKEEMNEYIKEKKEDIGDELADVLNLLLIISHDLDIDLLEALDKKLKKNAEKYPVEKAKGKHTKYNKF